MEGTESTTLKCDETTWRARDLRKSLESSSRDFLAREIALGNGTGQRMAKTQKEVQVTKASLSKVCVGNISPGAVAALDVFNPAVPGEPIEFDIEARQREANRSGLFLKMICI